MRLSLLWMGAAGIAILTATGAANDSALKLPVIDVPKLTPSLSSTTASTLPSLPRPTPPPVIPYEKLIPLLPEPPAGWTAEKPGGSTTSLEVFMLSSAARTYQKGDDEDAPVATVTIIDAGGHKGYFDVTTSGWKASADTSENYDRIVDIDGMRGFEHYNKVTRSCSLCVVVAQRFFVQIELSNQGTSELRDWLKKIDLKKLEALK